MKRPYTFSEMQFIRENYKRHSDAQRIAVALGRSKGAVCTKISKMGIAIPNKIEFSPIEIKFMRENYRALTNRQIAQRLGKKKTVVRNKLRELRLSRGKGKPWTAQEDAILLHNYRTKGNKAIAALTGRSKGGIVKRMRTLKLQRTPAELAALNEARLRKFLAHSFKHGHKGGNNNPAKAWETRRLRESSHETILLRIQQRENLFAR